MSRRRVGAGAIMAVGIFWVSALVPACLSPTLPVPPPEPAELQEPLARLLAGGTTIEIAGTGAEPGALVHIWNEETQDGQITRADGRGAYQRVLGVALSCSTPRNHVALWQTAEDGTTSRIRTYRLPNMFGDSLPPENDPQCRDAGSLESGASDVAPNQNTGGDDVEKTDPTSDAGASGAFDRALHEPSERGGATT